MRAQSFELGIERRQRSIDARASESRARMPLRHPRLRYHAGEHRLLPYMLAAHRRFISSSNPLPMIANGEGFPTAF